MDNISSVAVIPKPSNVLPPSNVSLIRLAATQPFEYQLNEKKGGRLQPLKKIDTLQGCTKRCVGQKSQETDKILKKAEHF
jgi:hypothetical protein